MRVATGQPAIAGRGVRVLSLDGGGMRGLAMVHMMRHIERRTGRAGGREGRSMVVQRPAHGLVSVSATCGLLQAGSRTLSLPSPAFLQSDPCATYDSAQDLSSAAPPPLLRTPRNSSLRSRPLPPGRRIHELFDLVVGTSTGAMLAVGLGVLHFSLDQCEAIYTGLGNKVFNQVGGPARCPRLAPPPRCSFPTIGCC